ncbi:MAG: hypothetical protein LBS19_13930 [Clostridiales bacterium]|jgi:predicted membrane chloride channel (bestrophin family)|nr:hypothetical protein [Clostridiales bacterium]
MKKILLQLKRNVAVTLSLHTAVVLMIGLLCAALSGELARIVGVVVSIVAITVFTIKNICRYVSEDFEERAKDLDKGTAYWPGPGSIERH